MNLSALITIKRLLEMAIEQAKTELETSKKRYSTLKKLVQNDEGRCSKSRNCHTDECCGRTNVCAGAVENRLGKRMGRVYGEGLEVKK